MSSNLSDMSSNLSDIGQKNNKWHRDHIFTHLFWMTFPSKMITLRLWTGVICFWTFHEQLLCRQWSSECVMIVTIPMNRFTNYQPERGFGIFYPMAKTWIRYQALMGSSALSTSPLDQAKATSGSCLRSPQRISFDTASRIWDVSWFRHGMRENMELWWCTVMSSIQDLSECPAGGNFENSWHY